MMRPWFLFVAATLLALACGGSEQQKAKTADPVDDSDPPERPIEKSGNQRSLDEHRRAFMKGCLARVPEGTDYCDCGWEQMQKVFSEADMNSESKPEESKLQELRDRTAERCQTKLPEGKVRDEFVNDCAAGTPDLAPYCTCAWTELRKTFSIPDFADKETMGSRRFAEAKKAMSRKCGSKMPEQVVRDEFMRGCLKVDVQAKSFCSCVWKTLRTKMSPAEIASAEASEFDVHEQRIRTSCGALRGKK